MKRAKLSYKIANSIAPSPTQLKNPQVDRTLPNQLKKSQSRSHFLQLTYKTNRTTPNFEKPSPHHVSQKSHDRPDETPTPTPQESNNTHNFHPPAQTPSDVNSQKYTSYSCRRLKLQQRLSLRHPDQMLHILILLPQTLFQSTQPTRRSTLLQQQIHLNLNFRR